MVILLWIYIYTLVFMSSSIFARSFAVVLGLICNFCIKVLQNLWGIGCICLLNNLSEKCFHSAHSAVWKLLLMLNQLVGLHFFFFFFFFAIKSIHLSEIGYISFLKNLTTARFPEYCTLLFVQKNISFMCLEIATKDEPTCGGS